MPPIQKKSGSTKEAGAGLKSVDLWRYSGRQGWLGFLHCSVVCRPTTQCLLKIFLRWVVETDLGIGHPLEPAADYILLSTVERKCEQILIFSFYIYLFQKTYIIDCNIRNLRWWISLIYDIPLDRSITLFASL